VLKLLEQHGLRLHLRPALQAAASGYGRIGENKALDVAKLETFFMTRLQVLLKDDGIGPDRVDAVFSLGLDDTVDVARRARALEAFMKTPDGAALHAGYKRAANVLAKAEKSHGLVDTALLKEPAEKDLFLAYEKAAAAVDVALKAEDYAAAMTALAALRAPVDAFFAGVMVMADEPALRHTRVALVQGLVQLFGRVAVFGKLAG
jgi:glycyl-tRNA synthetase beta chain